MNCNPFTYGHRYLVEYASRQVDYLNPFVVEEDLSAIPFFKIYFEKETDVHNVNAEEDVYIFAR